MGIRDFRKILITAILFYMLILGSKSASGQIGALAPSEVYIGDNTVQTPIRFWRENGFIFSVNDSQIFPMTSLGADGSFENLGISWMTWTIEVQGLLKPAFAIFERGQIDPSRFRIIDGFYKEVSFFGIQDQLLLITSTRTLTTFWIFNLAGQNFQPFSQEFNSTDHQVFITPTQAQLYFKQDGFQNTTITLNSLSVGGVLTRRTDVIKSTFISTAPGMALVSNGSSLSLRSQLGNFTVPVEFTENSKVGHTFLSPTIFDFTLQKMWNINNETVDLPINTVDVYPLGLASSIVRTANNTFYEYVIDHWKELGSVDPSFEIQYASIVDIGLYMLTYPQNGLNILLLGSDEDEDFLPDTFEDYTFTFPNKVDSDHDTIPDGIEVANGINPNFDDRVLDYDKDGINNLREINLGLDPRNPDSDYGGALDGWEVDYGYNALSELDDRLDPDGDGLLNSEESIWGTAPNNTDTDGDGMPDLWETQFRLNPTDPRDANDDPDGDGVSNLEEYRQGTDPLIRNPLQLYEGLYLVILLILTVTSPITYLLWNRIMKEESK